MFDGPMLSAAAYMPDTAARVVEDHRADAIAFGRLFLASPDLVMRIRQSQPLNAFDRSHSMEVESMDTLTTKP